MLGKVTKRWKFGQNFSYNRLSIFGGSMHRTNIFFGLLRLGKREHFAAEGYNYNITYIASASICECASYEVALS